MIKNKNFLSIFANTEYFDGSDPKLMNQCCRIWNQEDLGSLMLLQSISGELNATSHFIHSYRAKPVFKWIDSKYLSELSEGFK